MTRIRRSKSAVLTGFLVLTVAVALPLLPAFGEGGARRDVVRHAAESRATTVNMLYLVEFEATQAGAAASREQIIEQLNTLLIPTLERLGKEGKVRAGGTVTGTFAGAFIVEVTSKDEVNELLRALPAQSILQWKVTQLEAFTQRADLEKKVLQELRAQK